MLKATLYVREDPALLNNAVFSGKSLYGMKSDMYMYVALRKELGLLGVDLSTQDINPVHSSGFIIVLNETLFFKNYQKTKEQKLYLILSEPPVYNFEDWKKENHLTFDKIFVYDDRLADNIKYFHYNFAIDFESFDKPGLVSRETFSKKKLCVLMAGTFSVLPHRKEMQSLLHERYKAISWFNRNFPNDLDFFSRVIIEKKFEEFKGSSYLNKISPSLVGKIASYKFKRNCEKVFKGSVEAEKKIETMKAYKFYLCYENSHGINGLISEKIFDCFAASCIPVYEGAPDITRYIPPGCFINKEDFKSYPALHHYLVNMSYEEYSGYIENMLAFMNSEEIDPFKVCAFTKKIIAQIELV
jgi:hypothetical protein